MLPQQQPTAAKQQPEQVRPVAIIQPSSPRYLSSTKTPTSGANRKIAIAVDLSDESAFAVKWAVQNYLRPGDAVILLHVRPTSVLYGADWGSIDLSVETDEESQQKLEEDFDALTTTKANDLAQPLVEAHIPFKLHIVKDHDMKERLCLEVERLGLSAVIMGSRGFGATKRGNKGRLGSVSDYCVHHCVCPVVVVRFPEEKEGGGGGRGSKFVAEMAKREKDEAELRPVLEEDVEFHDASDGNKDERTYPFMEAEAAELTVGDVERLLHVYKEVVSKYSMLCREMKALSASKQATFEKGNPCTHEEDQSLPKQCDAG